jgi:hypothetical protein
MSKPLLELNGSTLDTFLNPFVLLTTPFSTAVCLIISVVSASFAFIISWYCYKPYRFSHFGHLLGLPTGFVLLGICSLVEYFSFIFRTNDLLYPELFWIQIMLQSEGLVLIAISYKYKGNTDKILHQLEEQDQPEIYTSKHKLHYNSHIRLQIKHTLVSCVIVGFVLVPVLVEVSDIILNPYLRHSDLVDVRILMSVFNMLVLAYIFKSTFDSLIRKADIKLLCVPAAFTLLWLEQLLLLMTYFDGGPHTFISSLVFRLAGLFLFAYGVYYAKSLVRRRVPNIET